MTGNCDTCGAKDVELFVYALPGIPISVGNCRVCMEVSAYPWPILVGNTAAIGGMAEAADWWKEEVRVSLARHGKTRAEFMAAIEADLKDSVPLPLVAHQKPNAKGLAEIAERDAKRAKNQ